MNEGEAKGMLKNIIKEFITEEEGIGVVEIILILVVLIGLVIIFQKQISQLVNSIFKSISTKKDAVVDYEYK